MKSVDVNGVSYVRQDIYKNTLDELHQLKQDLEIESESLSQLGKDYERKNNLLLDSMEENSKLKESNEILRMDLAQSEACLKSMHAEYDELENKYNRCSPNIRYVTAQDEINFIKLEFEKRLEEKNDTILHLERKYEMVEEDTIKRFSHLERVEMEDVTIRQFDGMTGTISIRNVRKYLK